MDKRRLRSLARLNLRRKSFTEAEISQTAGFSLPELLIASLISIVLATVVSALVLGAIAVTSRSQGNMTVGIRAQNALVNFETNARDAYKILDVSTTEFSFLRQRENSCEKHGYVFVPEEGSENYFLEHTIRSVTSDSGLSCADVADQLSSDTIGSPTVIAEAEGLLFGSFSFFGADGMPILVSGDEGYDPAAAVPACKIGSAEMTVGSLLMGEGSTTTREESTRAAFRANMMGLSC